MKCLMNDNGSVYLHCDPTVSHYLKMLMDAAFGSARFLNEMTRKRSRAVTAPYRLRNRRTRLQALDQ